LIQSESEPKKGMKKSTKIIIGVLVVLILALGILIGVQAAQLSNTNFKPSQIYISLSGANP
jgi:flagellar basal body-associated protein FliL